MRKTKRILTIGVVLAMLVPVAIFANGSKFLNIEALGKTSHIKLNNYVGKAPEMAGRKVVYFTKDTEWDGTSKDIDLNNFDIIDDTAIIKGKAQINRVGSPGMSGGYSQHRIIGRLDDGTLVVQGGDRAISVSQAKTLGEGEYVLSEFIDDGKFIMAEKVGYLRVEGEVTATPTSARVLIDNKQVSFEAYTIGNSNYIKLRDFAYAVNGTGKQFQVSWDTEKNAINLVPSEPYSKNGSEFKKGNGAAQSPVLNKSRIYKDGQEIDLQAYTIGGNNYFKLRDLAGALDITVTWDQTTSTIGINTDDTIETNRL